MNTEIKSITLGSSYDFIQLDKYTNNKNSIKVTMEDTGDDFTEWTLSDFGTLDIELGVIDYGKYKSPYQIKVIVEYEPSELPLSLDDINTLDGLKKNIIDLKSLDYIYNIRLVAYRKFNIILNEFILFNYIYFDSFGQMMKVECENIEKYDFDDFLTIENFKSKISKFSLCGFYIPDDNSICPHCRQKWNLNNLRDCIKREGNLYHLDCNKFSLYEKSKKEFDYIATNVFIDYSLHAVKNEYGSEEYNGCWFIINTCNGDIKIGWRKRVISIEWLENYKEFKFTGMNEKVTKCFDDKRRYIHSDNTLKTIEYLKEANETIIKQ